MKKFLFLLTICSLLAAGGQAQLKNGYYKIQLIASSGYLNYDDVLNGRITVKNACTATNCNNQIWLVKKRTAGGKTSFTIESPIDHKFLTWANNSSENPGGATIVTKGDRDITDALTKTFLLENRDGGDVEGGMFKIQPNIPATTTANYFYVGQAWAGNAVHAASDNYYASIDNKNPATSGPNASREENILWMMTPAKPSLSPANATHQDLGIKPAISVPLVSNNKIEVEFKTGVDNLEPRDFQENVEVRIKMKNHPEIVKTNVNENQSWPTGSIRKISLPLPSDVVVDDLTEVQVFRRYIGALDNFKDAVADNWDLARLAVTAYIKTDGRLQRYPLLEKTGKRPWPLRRFVYELRGERNEVDGYDLKLPLAYTPNLPTPIGETPAPEKTFIEAIFNTGGDDLRGGNDNATIKLILKNGQTITIANINYRRPFENFSEKKLTKDIPRTDFTFDDIARIELWHTGGGGIGADNWDLDRFKLTITINGNSKVLVDKAGTPLHRFTGDTRRVTWAPLP